LNQETYRKLISGQGGGLDAIFLRFFLALAAVGYSLVIRLRNFLYSTGWRKAHCVNAVVFSIGNITAGGTGKTPLVIWLCNILTQNSNLSRAESRELKTQKYGCAILTRGYKATQNSNLSRAESRELKTQNYGDEPAILAEECPQVKVIVNPDRIAAAAEAINKFGAKVIILDDGFQHRRLARDLDIVTIDATEPFGYFKLIPAGLLREPVTALKRAHAAIITRCDQTTEARLAEIEKNLQQINHNMIIARSIHAPICAKYAEHPVIPAKAGIQNNYDVDSCLRRNDNLETLKNKKIFAFCGIGNPNAFLETIKGLGCELVGSITYSDHHHYTESDITDIHRQAEQLRADLILTTQKDWPSTQYAIRNTQYAKFFAYLAIEIQFLSGEDKLKALIEKTLADKITTT
jgi:tetraacyldisaccharide 4'-kinase